LDTDLGDWTRIFFKIDFGKLRELRAKKTNRAKKANRAKNKKSCEIRTKIVIFTENSAIIIFLCIFVLYLYFSFLIQYIMTTITIEIRKKSILKTVIAFLEALK
jgi:hypothetical protein